MIKKTFFFFGIFLFLFCVFATFRCWTIPDTFIFRSDVSGSVYFPTFYPATDRERLDFSTGSASVTRKNFDSAPILEEGGFSLYSPEPKSSFCQENAAYCQPGPNGILILTGTSKGGLVTTSSYARIDEMATSLAHLRTLVSSGSPSQRLFVVSIYGNNKTIHELSEKEGRFRLDLRGTHIFSYKLLCFAAITAFLIACFFALITSSGSILFFRSLYLENRYSALILVVWWGVFYLCIFPSIFSHDTVIHNANAQIYTDWYSGLYFIYTACIRIVGFEWIQLLPAVSGLLSGIILLRCGSMATSARPKWQSRALSALTVVLLIGNPALVTSMFSQQRYFVVIEVAFLAISMWFYVYFRFLEKKNRHIYQMTSGVVFVSGLAWLLRPEYLIFFAFSYIFFGLAFVLGRKIFSIRCGLSVISCAFVMIVGLKFFIDRAMPSYYGYDRTLAAERYKTVSAIAMATPFICRSNPEHGITSTMERFGSINILCENGPEAFWWRVVSPQARPQTIELMRKMRGNVLSDVEHDPITLLRYRMLTGYDLFKNDIWQMDNPYHRRDIAREFHSPTDQNIMIPDRFGLIHDYPLTRGLTRALTDFYAWTGSQIGIKGMITVCIFSVVVLATGWAWLTPFFSLLFLAMIIPIVLVSPALNWAYIAFMPVWASFALPLGISEALITQRAYARAPLSRRFRALVEHAQRFIRFAVLSGCCWLLDASTLLILTHANRLPTSVANVISSCLASAIVFLVSRRRIHDGAENGAVGRTAVYMAYTVISILVASFILPFIVQYITKLEISGLSSAKIVLLAKVIITPPQLLCNFFMSRCVARYRFSSKRP